VLARSSVNPRRNTSVVVITGIRVVQVRLAIVINIRVRNVQVTVDALSLNSTRLSYL